MSKRQQKMSRALGFSSALLLVACGVEFIKPASSDEMAKYSTAIAFAKDRYTGFQASMWTAQWWQGSQDDVEVAAFRISSNTNGWLGDQEAFERDMASFCTNRGGQYTTLFKPDAAKIAAALMSDQAGSAAGMFLRHRNGNPPTFECKTGNGEYLFYGEAMYHPEPNSGVSIRVRLNQGAAGASLRRSNPSVQ